MQVSLTHKQLTWISKLPIVDFEPTGVPLGSFNLSHIELLGGSLLCISEYHPKAMGTFSQFDLQVNRPMMSSQSPSLTTACNSWLCKTRSSILRTEAALQAQRHCEHWVTNRANRSILLTALTLPAPLQAPSSASSFLHPPTHRHPQGVVLTSLLSSVWSPWTISYTSKLQIWLLFWAPNLKWEVCARYLYKDALQHLKLDMPGWITYSPPNLSVSHPMASLHLLLRLQGGQQEHIQLPGYRDNNLGMVFSSILPLVPTPLIPLSYLSCTFQPSHIII